MNSMMEHIEKRLAAQDWPSITATLHDNGFAVVNNVLTKEACAALIAGYETEAAYRKTIQMER